jgi:holo-[acyl-carrier protein] synthase
VDLVEIARVKLLIERYGDRALERMFTRGERDYADRRGDPARHYAARIAAKEAAFKALAGHTHGRGIAWREMEVVSGVGAAPTLLLHDLAERCARELGVTRTWLTLTHERGMAAAMVVVERGTP